MLIFISSFFSECNCHGHSEECEYSNDIDQKNLSLDMHGKYNGGGVCLNCRHNTAGVNCEKCKPFFYRPTNVPKNSPNICQRKLNHVNTNFRFSRFARTCVSFKKLHFDITVVLKGHSCNV